MPVAIGLSNVHFAILTKDDETGVAYQPPERIYGAVTANKNPNPSTETLYADDGPNESATSLGAIELELTMKDLPLAQQAKVLGHQIVNGRLRRRSTDTPPYIAVGYRRLMNDGSYRYKWLLKGKASEPSEEAETKGDSINYQTPSFTVSFVHRDYDDEWENEADISIPGVTQEILDKWFDAVEPTTITADLTVTTSPTDGATAVPVDTTMTWTASQNINPATVNENTVFVLSDDGTAVNGTLTVQDKVITFTPASPLSAATKYSMIMTTGVQDVYGNNLASAKIAKFTTA